MISLFSCLQDFTHAPPLGILGPSNEFTSRLIVGKNFGIKNGSIFATAILIVLFEWAQFITMSLSWTAENALRLNKPQFMGLYPISFVSTNLTAPMARLPFLFYLPHLLSMLPLALTFSSLCPDFPTRTRVTLSVDVFNVHLCPFRQAILHSKAWLSASCCIKTRRGWHFPFTYLSKE